MPRWTRKQSNGPGTAPTEFCTNRTASWSSGSATTTAPPTTSECPPRYLVVEWTTAPAPSSSGRWTTGVAKVLSTATSASPAISAIAAMSTMLSSGLVGVSTQITRVLGRIAARTASRSVWSTRSYSIPNRAHHLVDQPVGAAVEVEREDHVIAGIAGGGDQGVGRGHPAREGRAVTALQRAERALERRPGRVRRARVVEVLDELTRERSARRSRSGGSPESPSRSSGRARARRARRASRIRCSRSLIGPDRSRSARAGRRLTGSAPRPGRPRSGSRAASPHRRRSARRRLHGAAGPRPRSDRRRRARAAAARGSR